MYNHNDIPINDKSQLSVFFLYIYTYIFFFILYAQTMSSRISSKIQYIFKSKVLWFN